MKKFYFVILSSLSLAQDFVTCAQDLSKQELRSKELQEIVKADQEDRSGDIDTIDWSKVLPRDEARRKRVGEIFGEGCFKTAEDYGASALVYQHGNIPDHFFQTFLWAKRAVELGDSNQKWLMAAGIDRYLVNLNQKQLFATQFSKPLPSPCWCLEQVEESFPKELIKDYTKKTIQNQLDFVKVLNAKEPSCQKVNFCEKPLKNSPKGTVPGFW